VINDIDEQRRIRALIGTVRIFVFGDGVVWWNLSDPELTLPGDIDVRMIREKWEPGRIRRTFLTLCEISVARMFDRPQSLFSGPRFDVYLPKYWHGREWQICGLSQA
jgi:hypothetical protein